MPDDVSGEIYQELVKLRGSRALQATRLRPRLGPRLRAACGIQPGDNDQDTREKVTGRFRGLTAGFPDDLRLAVAAAFAVAPCPRYHKLQERQQWLAVQLHYGERNARRRVDEACRRLADALWRDLRGRRADPEQGWRVKQLNALLCLDTPSPELYEERTIVATQDDLAEIQTRVSLPVPGDGSRGQPGLVTKVLYGVTLRREEPFRGRHFRHTLALPRALRQGEEVSYKIMYEIPRDRMYPHYAFFPLAPCDSFQVRVRFDRQRLPAAVWQLERVPYRLLDEEDPAAPRLDPDPAGDVCLGFADLFQGLGYGLAWRPGTGPSSDARADRHQETDHDHS